MENNIKFKRMIYLAILVSLGLALHIIEGFIPNPFVGIAPGAKLGLANIIGLITLVLLGVKSALTVNVMRSFFRRSCNRSGYFNDVQYGGGDSQHTGDVVCIPVFQKVFQSCGSECFWCFIP